MLQEFSVVRDSKRLRKHCFFKKKLMVIPMKTQFEQHCNAAALNAFGIPVIKSLKRKHIDKIKAWINSDVKISVNYPDATENIINMILEQHLSQSRAILPGKKINSEKKFRQLTQKKIMTQLSA